MAWIAALVTAAGTAYGADQAGDAADAQSDAARRAGQLTQRQWNQVSNWLSPYRTAGDQALGKISRVMGLGGAAPDFSEFQESPGYQFRLSEGNRALDRGAAGRGMLLSGAQLKASQRYNQGMASNEFDNWFNRLYGLAGSGQNAAAQGGAMGLNAAGTIGNYMMMGGNAQANGITNQTNQVLNGLGSLANIYGQNQSRSSGYTDTSEIGASPDAYRGNEFANWVAERRANG